MSSEALIPALLAAAWLLPLLGFVIQILWGPKSSRTSRASALIAVGCIAAGFVFSLSAFVLWGSGTGWAALESHGHDEHGAAHASAHGEASHEAEDHGHSHDRDDAHGHSHDAPAGEAAAHGEEAHVADGGHDAAGDEEGESAAVDAGTGSLEVITGNFYTLARFGSLRIAIDYYIDSLTITMFVMVTLIATCIHLFALGYMSDELTEDHVDHSVHLPGGKHLHRPGRFYRFFAYMSLFCFSMLGLVLAGNIFQVFVFWELVGICSYLLIGFYIERKSASTAANKAFIMNRVGDFGFLIGLMVIWTWFGTFEFGTVEVDGAAQAGLFEMVRGDDGQLTVEDGNVILHGEGQRTIPYQLLVIAGLGIFAGCVGKSAQFPLQTWLPDAMEGPTPVSALVHSATMVAAGVYLAGRFYPMFTPEVLLTIAYVGCITLFVAATIAIVATDIKKVLAYSTISQLGYMMLAIGVGGWFAGLFHLITHAFFKSLMFLASGSVIVGCHHEQEMPRMGGLWRKMPITAFSMLAGVIAISGLAIPGTTIAFSGFHSKDAIVATALGYTQLNPLHFLLFLVPLVTAGLTAFYMFRLWFYTFAGKPRDQHIYDHCHESPAVMTVPLIVLSLFAAFVAIGGEEGPLAGMLKFSEPAGVSAGLTAGEPALIALPSADYIHGHVDAAGQLIPEDSGRMSPHAEAGLYALLVAFAGAVLAWLLYGLRIVNPAEIGRHLSGLHGFLVEKWQFDTLYDVMFVRSTRVVAGWAAAFDRVVFDGFLHSVCRGTVNVSRWDRKFDESIIDGLVNLVGDSVFTVGRSLRRVQTGHLRQYVMFIAVGVMALFVLLFAFAPR
ncbi:MAG: NADH-quinone oxidoreductase subunit L [Planctomycetaceae bacterium]|nr:NADH-quinone oxidoreductase subunit L [Planctomycetaceae bacterium]